MPTPPESRHTAAIRALNSQVSQRPDEK